MKLFFLACAVVGLVYAVYEYRGVLFFWKYNISKLDREIMAVDMVQDRQRRLQMLADLDRANNVYKKENPMSVEAHLTSGKVHYLLGEAHLPARFNELLITDRLGEVDGAARVHFIASIKDVKKAIALSGGGVQEKYLVMLARSCFITGYYGMADIAEILTPVRNPEILDDLDDRRFIAMVHVLNSNENYGLELLNKIEGSGGTPSIYMATLYRIAKKYTNALMEYRKVLDKTADIGTRNLIHFNLGKIYYTQGLHAEALREFAEAVTGNPTEISYRIWAGKSHASMGDKAKARESWLAAQNIDKNNEEVKKLLEGR